MWYIPYPKLKQLEIINSDFKDGLVQSSLSLNGGIKILISTPRFTVLKNLLSAGASHGSQHRERQKQLSVDLPSSCMFITSSVPTRTSLLSVFIPGESELRWTKLLIRNLTDYKVWVPTHFFWLSYQILCGEQSGAEREEIRWSEPHRKTTPSGSTVLAFVQLKFPQRQGT